MTSKRIHTDECSMKVNSRSKWQIQHHGWGVQQRNWDSEKKNRNGINERLSESHKNTVESITSTLDCGRHHQYTRSSRKENIKDWRQGQEIVPCNP
jgi:Ni/Co efflux regulator RcnB